MFAGPLLAPDKARAYLISGIESDDACLDAAEQRTLPVVYPFDGAGLTTVTDRIAGGPYDLSNEERSVRLIISRPWDYELGVHI